MKLTIRSGESVENAIRYLTEYLDKYKEDYPLLKGNMNVYVTVEGFGHRSCPDNEKELILTGEQENVDVEASRLLAKQKECLEGWKRFVTHQQNAVRRIAMDIDTDIRYLKTAEEKGRKPENIEKRRTQLAEKETELKEAKDYMNFVNALNELVSENRVKWYLEKHTKKQSAYTYTITPYLIFEDVNGEDWHFVGYQSRYETAYGSLNKGLPYSLRETK